MAGGLDERCADAWDVETEGSGSDAASASSGGAAGASPRKPRKRAMEAMEQGTGLAAARQGIAGREQDGAKASLKASKDS